MAAAQVGDGPAGITNLFLGEGTQLLDVAYSLAESSTLENDVPIFDAICRQVANRPNRLFGDVEEAGAGGRDKALDAPQLDQVFADFLGGGSQIGQCPDCFHAYLRELLLVSHLDDRGDNVRDAELLYKVYLCLLEYLAQSDDAFMILHNFATGQSLE